MACGRGWPRRPGGLRRWSCGPGNRVSSHIPPTMATNMMMPVTIKARRVPVVMATSGPPAAPPGGIQTAAHRVGRGREHRARADDPARPRQSHDPVSVARTSRRPDHASPSPPPITCTRWQLRAGKRLPHGHTARAFRTGVHADQRDPSHLVMARLGSADLEIVDTLITGASRPAAPKPCAAASDPPHAHRHHTKDPAALEMLCPRSPNIPICAPADISRSRPVRVQNGGDARACAFLG
jgi:hypothetical protein